jgi:hypothetical protein
LEVEECNFINAMKFNTTKCEALFTNARPVLKVSGSCMEFSIPIDHSLDILDMNSPFEQWIRV